MKRNSQLTPILLALVSICPLSLHAQWLPSSVPSLNGAFLRLFEDTGPFTARMEAQVFDKSEKESLSLPMAVAALDRKFRVEIQLDQVKGKDAPELALGTLKRAGLTQIVTLLRPDKELTYIICPGIRALAEEPMDQAAIESKSYRLERTPLGKEPIEGRVCSKTHITLSKPGSTPIQGTVWEASDLKGFPVRLEIPGKEKTTRINFKDVRLGIPDAKQFDLPAGFTVHKDTASMLLEAIKKAALGEPDN